MRSEHHHQLPSRRKALQIGGLGLLGMSLPTLLAAEKPARLARPGAFVAGTPPVRAKSVIFLFQWGGPSQLDMFDMKPSAPDTIRSPYRPIATSAPEISICEHLPELAKHMDKICLVRSMTHTMKNHASAGYYAITGHQPPSDD